MNILSQTPLRFTILSLNGYVSGWVEVNAKRNPSGRSAYRNCKHFQSIEQGGRKCGEKTARFAGGSPHESGRGAVLHGQNDLLGLSPCGVAEKRGHQAVEKL